MAATDVIINQPLARQHWPEGRGVGETLRIGQRRRFSVTVIGITAQTHTRGLNREAAHALRARGPLSNSKGPDRRGAHRVAAGRARASVHRSRAGGRFRRVAHVAQDDASSAWPCSSGRSGRRAGCSPICGVLALILATVGLAGVVIHAVNRRLREFGVRVSVGATPARPRRRRAEEQRRPSLPGTRRRHSRSRRALARLVQAVFLRR